MAGRVPLVLALVGLLLTLAGLGLLLPANQTVWRRLRSASQAEWRIERLFYRHHRWTGFAILASGLAALVLLAQISIPAGSGLKPISPALSLLVLLVRGALMFFAAVSAMIGAVVMMRPSVLKPIETRANATVDPVGVLANRLSFSADARHAGAAMALSGGFACLLAAGVMAVG